MKDKNDIPLPPMPLTLPPYPIRLPLMSREFSPFDLTELKHIPVIDLRLLSDITLYSAISSYEKSSVDTYAICIKKAVSKKSDLTKKFIEFDIPHNGDVMRSFRVYGAFPSDFKSLELKVDGQIIDSTEIEIAESQKNEFVNMSISVVRPSYYGLPLARCPFVNFTIRLYFKESYNLELIYGLPVDIYYVKLPYPIVEKMKESTIVLKKIRSESKYILHRAYISFTS